MSMFIIDVLVIFLIVFAMIETCVCLLSYERYTAVYTLNEGIENRIAELEETLNALDRL